jgi:hypothetical protein
MLLENGAEDVRKQKKVWHGILNLTGKPNERGHPELRQARFLVFPGGWSDGTESENVFSKL